MEGIGKWNGFLLLCFAKKTVKLLLPLTSGFLGLPLVQTSAATRCSGNSARLIRTVLYQRSLLCFAFLAHHIQPQVTDPLTLLDSLGLAPGSYLSTCLVPTFL